MRHYELSMDKELQELLDKRQKLLASVCFELARIDRKMKRGELLKCEKTQRNLKRK